jgi:REP element-mobilizing transposase RayT
MPRARRVQFEGAIYHVFTTGVRNSHIYLTRDDRDAFVSTLANVCNRTGWEIYSDCQMGTHYHLLLETPRANLAEGMQLLNGAYASRFNRRHDLRGHLFKGRYGARLVKSAEHALELIRYIALNPFGVEWFSGRRTGIGQATGHSWASNGPSRTSRRAGFWSNFMFTPIRPANSSDSSFGRVSRWTSAIGRLWPGC